MRTKLNKHPAYANLIDFFQNEESRIKEILLEGIDNGNYYEPELKESKRYIPENLK